MNKTQLTDEVIQAFKEQWLKDLAKDFDKRIMADLFSLHVETPEAKLRRAVREARVNALLMEKGTDDDA